MLAGFRDLRLWPVGSRGEDHDDIRDESGRLRERGAVLDALSPSLIADWQRQMEGLAESTLDELPTDCPIDLLHEFAKPWCMSLAMLVTGADPGDRDRLSELGNHVFEANGELSGSPLKARAAIATAELKSHFQNGRIPMGEATFVGISQTLPRLLVNGWLALFRHPAEVSRLRAEPDLIPGAVEELLRYAGIIPRLFRRALEGIELGGVRIAKGELVHLMIASANRDPAQFPEPNRLDVSRRATGQLALGIGRNSCAGAILIRMANAVAIAAMLRTFREVTLTAAPLWRSGSGFCWPTSVEVGLQR